MTVECTFGHLKACWQALCVHIKVGEKYLMYLSTTICILYNIFKISGKVFHKTWLEKIFMMTRHVMLNMCST